VVVGVLLGILLALIGVWLARAFALIVRPDELELRFSFWTRRFPLAEVVGCELRHDSRGLLYTRIYPEFQLTGSRRCPFNAVRWLPRDADAAFVARQEIISSIDQARGLTAG
jgi:hypothetical protein